MQPFEIAAGAYLRMVNMQPDFIVLFKAIFRIMTLDALGPTATKD
jgi:hypothetical protein